MVLVLLIGVGGCRNGDQAAERLAEDSADARSAESNLTFNNITLEQANANGEVLWRVDAEQATYSQDQKVAEIINPEGELFQDGNLVFNVKADRGEVQQDGEQIFLRGNIVVEDTESGAILRGQEMEWRPQDDLLVVRDGLRGIHPQVRASAREARVFSRDRRMELSGQVVATTKEPNLRMRGNEMIWMMDEGTISSDRPVQVLRLQEQEVTDQAMGNGATVDLNTQVVTLTPEADVRLADPQIRVTSNSLVWNLENETLTSNQPLTVVHRQQRVTLTADQGRMDLTQRIFYLTSNVRALGQRNQSRLMSNSLVWNIPTQDIVAEGNVFYQQNDPQLNLRGQRATGKLQDQTIVVSGGRVVTEIVPESLN